MKFLSSMSLVVLLGVAAFGAKAAPRDDQRAAAIANWRLMATPADRNRLRTWRDAWMTALAKARATNAADIDRDPALFDPDKALVGAVPPPGHYRCSVYKLGANGAAMAEMTSYPPVGCRINDEGEVSSFYKMFGVQRPTGIIFHDDDSRAIFLGTLLIGDETRAMQYGRDGNRDLVGYVERIGEQRWRLVLPYPQFESVLDVVELVPAEPAQ